MWRKWTAAILSHIVPLCLFFLHSHSHFSKSHCFLVCSISLSLCLHLFCSPLQVDRLMELHFKYLEAVQQADKRIEGEKHVSMSRFPPIVSPSYSVLSILLHQFQYHLACGMKLFCSWWSLTCSNKSVSANRQQVFGLSSHVYFATYCMFVRYDNTQAATAPSCKSAAYALKLQKPQIVNIKTADSYP